jgi:hypothetical protein
VSRDAVRTVASCALLTVVVSVALVRCNPPPLKADASAPPPGWTAATVTPGFDAAVGK